MLMDWVIGGSGNGLAPVRRQVITWTNADLLYIGSLGTNFSEIGMEIPKCYLKTAFKNVVCEMAAILFGGGGGVYYW